MNSVGESSPGRHDPYEASGVDTTASRSEDYLGSTLLEYRQSGGILTTQSHDERPRLVKYVCIPLPHYYWRGNCGAVLRFEADQEYVGDPSDTVASLVSWPALWQHPERNERLRRNVLRPADCEEGEPSNWDDFINAFAAVGFRRDFLSERFRTLVQAWKDDVQFLSDTNEICTHPSYQQIIGMGPFAIPCIFEEMQKELGPWFWALKAITGADPVPDEDRGRVKRMTEHWVKWGKKNGYVR